MALDDALDRRRQCDRVEIAEYYLGRKAHTRDVTAAFVADVSAGYTPVRIERLLDEALIIAVRPRASSSASHFKRPSISASASVLIR